MCLFMLKLHFIRGVSWVISWFESAMGILKNSPLFDALKTQKIREIHTISLIKLMSSYIIFISSLDPNFPKQLNAISYTIYTIKNAIKATLYIFIFFSFSSFGAIIIFIFYSLS